MVQLDIAAISLLQLLGLLEETGDVSWGWLGDPVNKSLNLMPGRRQYFGRVLRALQGTTSLDAPYATLDADAHLVWEPLTLGTAPVQVGFAWTTEPDDQLRIAIAARANPTVGNSPLTLAVVAHLAGVTSNGSGGGSFASELGQLRFDGSFPVPDFLKSAALKGAFAPGQPFDLSLTAQDQTNAPNDADKRVLELDSPELGWDVARLATFVLQAFVAPRAAADAPSKGFFYRAQNHLLPLLGSGGAGGAIAPFPVFQPMRDPADFGDWKDSVFTQGGALTFLWHLRALITGNESPDFIKASFHLPLHGDQQLPDADGPPDPSAFTSQTSPANLTERGAWLGFDNDGAHDRVVLEVRTQVNGPLAVLPLATVVDGALVRPSTPAGELTKLGAGSFAIQIGDDDSRCICGTQEGSDWRITLFQESLQTDVDAFDGIYKFEVVVGDSVAFAIDTPLSGAVTVPGPGNQPATVAPEAAVATLVNLLVGAMPDAGHPLFGITEDLAAYITASLAGQQPSVGSVIETATKALGASGLGEFSVGDHLDVKLTKDGDLAFRGEIGPLDFGEQGKAEFESGNKMAVRIGKVVAEVVLDLRAAAAAPIKTFSVNIVDFRVALPSGQADGILASLLPDLKEAPGFTLGMTWTPATGPVPSGGGRIPVQQTIGPLTVDTLAVDVDAQRTRVGIDLSFQLSVVTVSAHELGIEFRYDGTVTPFLHGLALSCNAGGITLAGMFGAVELPSGKTDYVGGAVVSVMDLFALSAIGGYTQLEDKSSSLFLFASLVAPLGGPPWMFVTGIAGGFGYNRSLPAAGQITEHPFLKVMRGEIDLGSSSATALAAMSGQFAPEPGQHWIAAGVQFTSFGFINGKAVVVVGLGHEFSLSVLATAAFGIKPIAYFELGIEATANEQEFRLLAGVSPNSYIIHPDIFSLRGQFGLLVRHSGEGAGDFVFTIGGYHPSFNPPDYYPVVERVGCKAVVYGFVRLSVDAFFACTPQALMGGAKVSLAAEFEGIGAGLDVYVDAFMRWDPFFIEAAMGVCLWFEFFGRHEIGVDLRLHTPPFGGTATIDLALVSFDVDFGKQLNGPPEPTLAEFMTRQLGVPATPKSSGRVQHLRFNDGEHAGLFRVDVVSGRPADAPAWESDAQEGTVDPIRVNAEFEFTVKTRLPIAESAFDKVFPPGSAIDGRVDLPLCRLDGMDSQLKVTGAGIGGAGTSRLTEFFPKASFGDEPLKDAQADDLSARAAVAALATDKAVVPLTEGMRFAYRPSFVPASVDALTGGMVEYSLDDERYPLPLGVHVGQPPIVAQAPSCPFSFDFDKLNVTLRPSAGRASRAELALDAASRRENRPLHVLASRADVQRFRAAVRTSGFTVLTPPAGAAVIAMPASPPRRAELFGVNLRVVAPHAPVSLKRQRLDGVSRARNAERRTLTPPDGVVASHTATLSVAPFTTEQLTLDGGRTRGGRLALSGKQWVRAIIQSGSGAFLADQYIPAGMRTLALPKRARRVTLVGEGPEAPIAAADRMTLAAAQNLGVERDSVLMALGRGTFAGHGCVLESLASTGLRARPLDHAPGFAVLRATRRARVHFPAVSKATAWTLVLTVVPTDPAAGSAVEQVRWLSENATLSGLMTVISPDRTALMMTVAADRAWSLDLDLGNAWRLAGVAVAGQPTRELYDAFRTSADWNLVDDRLPQTADTTPTQVTAEIDYE